VFKAKKQKLQAEGLLVIRQKHLLSLQKKESVVSPFDSVTSSMDRLGFGRVVVKVIFFGKKKHLHGPPKIYAQ
jgi:hypothetical protein